MYTKKPKYNIQKRVYDDVTGNYTAQVYYYNNAYDASLEYLKMLNKYWWGTSENCKPYYVHYKLRTASTVLAQFYSTIGQKMQTPPKKQIEPEYKAAEKFLASEEKEAA